MADEIRIRRSLKRNDHELEIRAAIRYYRRRGWCWLALVEYLCWRGQ